MKFSEGPDRLDWLCLFVIVCWGLFWQAPNLGHPTIRDWDEVFHQAAARGTYESFFEPHIYRDHLYPVPLTDWWNAGIWLHKPTAPFWFAALVMKVIGVTPLALRLAGLLGQLGAAVALYLISRRAVGPFWALAAAAGFLALPFGWKLTQGFHFGDVTDATLVGWVSLAMLLSVRAIERDSGGWAAAAGAATGIAFLCKTALALVPLGTFGLLWLLRRWVRGPRLLQVVSFVLATVIVAAPWNLYSAWRWPEVFAAETGHTLGHIADPKGFHLGPWARPWDAIFNEVLQTEVSPLPHAFVVLAGVWLAIRAVRHRELPIVASAIWLWATWLIHSLTLFKVPAQVWNALPAAFIAVAALGSELWRRPVLAGAAALALLSPWIPVPGRDALPAFFEQTRTLPGLYEGLLLAAAGAFTGALLARLGARVDPLRIAFALAAPGLLGWALLFRIPSAQAEQVRALYPETLISYSADLGPALDRALPERSVLFQDLDRDPRGVLETQSLIFWSGRMVYRGPVDLAAARAKDYAPYLVSPVAEPFEPVPGVPAHAWLRAYDPSRPRATPAPLPQGAHPIDGGAVIAWASGRINARHDRYAFFVRPWPNPRPVLITWHLRDGSQRRERIFPEHSLRAARRLQGAPWYLAPAVGPPRDQVRALQFDQGPLIELAP